MAETSSSLKEYQSSILDRLEQAREAGAVDSSGHLGVMIADKHVLISMEEISETLPLLDIDPVPLVKPWFLGMANVRGVLYAINDLSELVFNQKTDLTSNSRVVLLNDDITTHVGFVIDRLIGLRNISGMQSVKVESDTSMGVKTERYEDEQHQLWYVIDCKQLVKSPTFIAST